MADYQINEVNPWPGHQSPICDNLASIYQTAVRGSLFLLDDRGGNDWLLQIICTYILHLGPLVLDQSR